MASVTAPRKSSKPARKPELVVSLALNIDHQVYMVTPIRAEDPEILKAWRLEKKSDGSVYDVAATVHGPTCDCGDQTFRHAGLDGQGCKHIKALTRLGLLEAPAAGPVDAPAEIKATVGRIESPAACCSPAEAAPCSACVEAPAGGAAFPGERLDPWDAEAPPELWPDDCDADTWCVTGDPPTPPDDDDDTATWVDAPDPDLIPDPDKTPDVDKTPDPDADEDPAFEPSPEDWVAIREMRGDLECRAHLDRSESMTLDGLASHVAAHFRSWDTEAGDLFARVLEETARRIRLLSARTPDEYLARIAVDDESERDRLIALGYDRGQADAREREACGAPFGHAG